MREGVLKVARSLVASVMISGPIPSPGRVRILYVVDMVAVDMDGCMCVCVCVCINGCTPYCEVGLFDFRAGINEMYLVDSI